MSLSVLFPIFWNNLLTIIISHFTMVTPLFLSIFPITLKFGDFTKNVGDIQHGEFWIWNGRFWMFTLWSAMVRHTWGSLHHKTTNVNEKNRSPVVRHVWCVTLNRFFFKYDFFEKFLDGHRDPKLYFCLMFSHQYEGSRALRPASEFPGKQVIWSQQPF